MPGGTAPGAKPGAERKRPAASCTMLGERSMPRPGFRRSRRARLALVLAVLWIVSFELGPLLHIAEHDRLPPHHHTALGIVWDDPGAQDAALHEVLDEVDSDSQVDEA